MSYNYDQCVQSIQRHRRKAYASHSGRSADKRTEATPPDMDSLQRSVEEFASLSKNCPMTPLLWMQYAHDTQMLIIGLYLAESNSKESNQELLLEKSQATISAFESSTGILEMALAEFPGCALLHLYYLENLAENFYQIQLFNKMSDRIRTLGVRDLIDQSSQLDKISTAFEVAVQNVGVGTHVNEGIIVAEIYRFYCSFLLARLSLVMGGEGTKNPESNVTEVENSTIQMKEEQGLSILQQLSLIFQQWSKNPMGEGSNDEIMQDLEYLWEDASAIFLSFFDGCARLMKQKHLVQQKVSLWETIDLNRKKASSLMNVLSSYENNVDVAMDIEAIMMPRYSLFPQREDNNVDATPLGRHVQCLHKSNVKWDQIIVGKSFGATNHRFLSGLGGAQTSQAFLNYTSFLQSVYNDIVKQGLQSKTGEFTPIQEHIADHSFWFILSLYERAVSECPTVEAVWVSFVRFLRGEWTRLCKGEQEHASELQTLSSMLQSITQRSCRNCPYSITAFELRMTTLGLVSLSNLEPDNISSVVQDAQQLGFLSQSPEALLYLRLVAIMVVKRKLLSLVSLGSTSGQGQLDFDQEESMNITASGSKKNKSSAGVVIYHPFDDSNREEAIDLVEDLRDMFDEADSFLFKSFPKWDEGRRIYWGHRASTEASVLCPLGLSFQHNAGESMDDNTEASNDNEVIRCYEKMVKAQKPCHPDAWREYLQYVRSTHLQYIGHGKLPRYPDLPGAVPSVIRKTRGLYNRAMSTVRKAGQTTNTKSLGHSPLSWMNTSIHGLMTSRDTDAALFDLCREFVEFERNFGTEESVAHAVGLVRSKLADWNPTSIAAAFLTPGDNQNDAINGKRKMDANCDDFEDVDSSHQGMICNEEKSKDHSAKRMKVKTDLKQPKKADGLHKVRVGEMEYPAHPYTVHVANLSKETEDMDLVDVFRKEFGPVVHARILREKVYGKGGHHFHGESKCAGLVQFEERSIVEKALEQDGVLEIDGKVVKVSRSHLPAVGIVPQGCHRVKPKGEGKSSKRNMLKKKSKMQVESADGIDVDDAHGKEGVASIKTRESKNYTPSTTKITTSSSPGSLSFDVLSFKPRNVNQKPKVSLGGKSISIAK
ncbi:hypothetical protein ACHAXS_004590 [Conticribra weissflogii]